MYTVSLWKYSVCSRICLFGILIAHCIGCTYWNGIVESSSISYYAVYTVSLWYLPFWEFWLLIVLVGGVSWRPLLHTADPWWFNCVKVIFEIVQKNWKQKNCILLAGWGLLTAITGRADNSIVQETFWSFLYIQHTTDSIF